MIVNPRLELNENLHLLPYHNGSLTFFIGWEIWSYQLPIEDREWKISACPWTTHVWLFGTANSTMRESLLLSGFRESSSQRVIDEKREHVLKPQLQMLRKILEGASCQRQPTKIMPVMAPNPLGTLGLRCKD